MIASKRKRKKQEKPILTCSFNLAVAEGIIFIFILFYFQFPTPVVGSVASLSPWKKLGRFFFLFSPREI